ncbi:unnamed protein product [Cylindrotheca closterium]|uniref:Uncharacterized protein n=1 Tax=Cylindrotheca closterium TaxID=2856 RepID=A0AAD2CG42_9STRA|nr:unnamed protein product [Cylindrotheca closterium]
MKVFHLLISLLFLARTYALSVLEPWPNGTKVFYYDKSYGEWINGKILEYDRQTELYTMKWEDGRTEDSSRFNDNDLYNMVENYETLWPIGTPLYNSVNATFGTVADLTQFGSYTITWENGDVENDQHSLDKVDTMVKDYMVYHEEAGLIPLGTHVYYYDEEDKKWDMGKVTKWTSTQGYTIMWGDNVTEIGLYTDRVMHDMVNNYKSKTAIESDEPIPEGTGVYDYDHEAHAWYKGTITKQSPQLGYTIMWENSAIEVAQYSHDEVRQMVLNFMNKDLISPDTEIIPVGTYVEQDGAITRIGHIKRWTPMDGYTVYWEDGSIDTKTYTKVQIDSMMRAYHNKNTDHWPEGTRLYQLHNNIWREGVISDWSSQTSYIITWKDGTIENNAYTGNEMNEMVKFAHLYLSEDSPYVGNSIAVGTPVFLNYDDEWYEGVITAYEPKEGYTITWNHGTEETNEYSKSELDEMIDNWKTKRPPSKYGPWVSSNDTNPMYGVLIFFCFLAISGPVLILFRKYVLRLRDEREIQDDDGEGEIMFQDPNALPSDPKLLPDAKDFA